MLEADLTFWQKVLKQQKKEYEEALKVSRKSETKLMELAWNLTGFTDLIKQATGFCNEIDVCLHHLEQETSPDVKKILPDLIQRL